MIREINFLTPYGVLRLQTALWASFLLMMLVMGVSAGRVKHYKWKVDYRFWSPDCVEKLIISINGQYPGPTIRVREGDTIKVELENLMPTEGVVIHWHGIHQRGSPWHDGTGGVSQCAIAPGEKFEYKFVADKAGTYFYHGHVGLQRSAGLYGSLIVEVPAGVKEPFQYDGELSLVLNDWWHRSAIEQGLRLFSNPFLWVDEPQSLLMNGRGQYNCSLIEGDQPPCNASNGQCSPLVLRVQPGRTYRLRIASVTSLSYLSLQIEGHTMTVVEVDGRYVNDVDLDNLNVHSGDSYSVLLRTYAEPPNGRKSFWVATHVRGREPKTNPGLGILVYGNNEVALLPTSTPPLSPAPWNDTAFSLNQSRQILARQGFYAGWVPPPPQSSEQQAILLNTQNRVDGVIKWAINNISLALPATPLLQAMRFRLKTAFDYSAAPPTSYPFRSYNIFEPPPNPNAQMGTQVYRLPLNSTVDFILQNANMLEPNDSGIHPWHMHGHDFWVLGYGSGAFDPTLHPQTFNLVNPPLRNTVPLYPYGWTAIRFIADNPGVWSFHCHLEPHMHMGMTIIFAEGVEFLATPPTSTLGCGLTKRLFQ
ncbi:hypothetical protein L7F22_056669 [Adiantum nelumboides]|nr:hypothetical protein [Adiantum nelumboides]